MPADSKTNTMLKSWKSLPTTEVARLPAGSSFYTSMAYTPELMKDLGSLAYGFADPDSKEGKAIKKLIGELAAAGPPVAGRCSSIPVSGLTVTKYDNPAKAVDAQLKLFKELKEGFMFGNVLKSDPVVRENAKKHGGFEFHHVSMKWDLEKTIEKQGGGDDRRPEKGDGRVHEVAGRRGVGRSGSVPMAVGGADDREGLGGSPWTS